MTARHCHVAIVLAIVLALFTCAALAHAEKTLNPKTYRSPSGAYTLFVDPSNMDGAGAGTYAFKLDGAEIWSGERPFTLWDAVVTDDGTIAGYAYEWGHYGWWSEPGSPNRLFVIVLEPDGKVRRQDARPRRDPGIFSTPPPPKSPTASGLFVLPGQDRFVVRSPNPYPTDGESWWIYELSTGARIRDILPGQPEAAENGHHNAIAAHVVPGTSLVLAHWYVWRIDRSHGEKKSARFNLLTGDGSEVWRLDVPAEYEELGEQWSWWDLNDRGVKQTSVRERGFDVRSFGLANRMSFEVVADEAAEYGWTVREIERVADGNLLKELEPVAHPEIELELLGTIELESTEQHGAEITNITGFAIDAAGRFGFMRRDGDAFTFLVADGEGRILGSAPIKRDDDFAAPVFAPVGPSRWIIARHAFMDDRPAQAWWYDLESNALTPYPTFALRAVELIVPFGANGFAVASGSSVITFDDEGHRRWSVTVPQSGILSGLAPRPGGGIAAVTQLAIELYAADGAHERTITLRRVPGLDIAYVATLAVDLDRTLLLDTSVDAAPLSRIAPDGTLQSQLKPRFADGSAVTMRHMQVGPDGSIWTADRYGFYRLDATGLVDKTVGAGRAGDGLQDFGEIIVGFDGRIFIGNRRTGGVHIFDAEGRQLDVIRPEAGTVQSGTAELIGVSPNGHVYTRDPDGRHQVYLASGRWMDLDRDPLDTITEEWHFQPGTAQRRWILGYHAIHLVGAGNAVLDTIERRPDGNWLEVVGNGCIAPDGSLAVATFMRGLGLSFDMDVPSAISIYSADGEPVRTIESTGYARVYAWNGRTLVTAQHERILVHDVETGSVHRQVFGKRGGRPVRNVVDSPGGREILVRWADSRTLYRYALPR